MRFFGHTMSSVQSAFAAGFLALLAAGTLAGAPAASAQTASPYVLPFTMSTFAGPHATYTAGAACGNYIALDTTGDGCLASQVSVGVDPHDIRVDLQGNIYWIDNESTAVIHRINGQTTRETVYVGSYANTGAACAQQTDTQGDGCQANDGGANVVKSMFTAKTPKSRGLGIANNGDLFYADYGGNYDHKVSAFTGILSVVAGTGTAGYVDSTPGKSQVSSSRGIGVDPSGNVYIADTGNNAIRFVPANGTSSGSLTAVNVTAPVSTNVTSGVPALQATVDAPEDVQIDSNYNIYIADFGDKVVRVIASGRSALPGIPAPTAGYIYTIAGTNNGNAGVTYTTNGAAVAPSVLATTVAFGGPRKISIDSRNNIYINDGNNVWFLDATTGFMRILAGNYSGTAGGGGVGCAASAAGTIGDGCPGAQAALYSASDLASAPDNQGNLYITDAEGGSAANSRLRKLLSGLNFPAVNSGSTLVQNLLIHFAVGDTPAAAGAYTISGSTAGTEDYTVGTQTCTLQTDNTTDCVVPITFKPVRPGYDTATLVIKSTLGTNNNYLLTGTGVANAIAIDPGSVSVQNANVKAAQGVAVDGAGNIYTADTGNNRILITSADTGATTAFAGTGTAGSAGNGGAATAATLNAPRAVTVDTDGNVYIADTGNNVVRRVAAGTGIITAYAGGAAAGCAAPFNALGDGCLATQATLSTPSGIVADSLGQIYVSDTGDNLIRVIGTNGYINTFAGGATSSTVCTSGNNGGVTIDVYGDNCNALQSVLKAPTALAYDSPGRNIIVADTGNNLVRKIYLGTIFEGTGAGSGGTVTAPTATAYTAVINQITAVAGTGAAGSVVDTNSTALGSQLNAPTGVAIGAAGSIYIADTGNSAVRLVSPTTGGMSVIVGILASAGTGTVPGTASNVQLTAPAAVAVTTLGTLQISDAGNNRILTDVRSQVAFQFGRTNVTFQSPVQNFIETNIGTAAATLPSPLLTQTPAPQTQFTLVPAAGNAGCVPGTLASGASCILQGQFTPAATGNFSTTFTEVGTMTATGDPAITLTGVGAVLTKTTSAVAQTSPATGNAQFGAALTVTATVTPASCNAAAPSCAPTGTVRFIVDGGNPGSPITVTPNATITAGLASQSISGLSVGSHIISCNYSGDNFYAASTCGTQTITVSTASTTSLLSATNNNQVQFLGNNCYVPLTGTYAQDTYCTVTTLTATVMSNTVGVPTGTVTFYANGISLGVSSLSPTTGTAALQTVYVLQGNNLPGTMSPLTYKILLDTTLAPGTYTLSCTYNGAANYSVSNCANVTYTVLAQPSTFSLQSKPCGLSQLIPDGSLTPVLAPCPASAVGVAQTNGTTVSTAQGSTTDATIFVLANNTVSGTLKFSCSGLPHASICTFSPTTLTATAGTTYAAPIATDMTLWTDLQPGPGVASNREFAGSVSMAGILGWPITLIGLAGFLRFRRKLGASKALSLLALVLMIGGSSLAVTGCGAGGPGAYKADLTPAGTYPITVTVTNGTVTQSTIVYWEVFAPGIPGQE